jgi:hypothetical protein
MTEFHALLQSICIRPQMYVANATFLEATAYLSGFEHGCLHAGGSRNDAVPQMVCSPTPTRSRRGVECQSVTLLQW